jgi:hypothetical protein
MNEKTKNKMKQEYFESNGTRCPICKSDNISVVSCCDDTDSADRIKRTVDCQEVECGAQWNDYYVLSEVDIVFDGKEEVEM